MLSATPWGDIAGYGWNSPADIRLAAKWQDVENYIATSPLIQDGKPLGKIPYDSAQGGRRPRTAMGIVGGSLLLFCSSDSMTPEALQDELEDRGCSSAMMLDSGGSTQCDFLGKTITAERKVHNFIAVWLKEGDKNNAEEEEEIEVVGEYRVTPDVGLNIRNSPSSSGDKVGAYAHNAVVTILEVKNGWGRTDRGWVSMEHLEEVTVDDEPEQETELIAGKYEVTPSVGLNIRREPNSNSEKVGAYSRGTVVSILEVKDGWGRTDKGWVSMEHLSIIETGERVLDSGIVIKTHYIAEGRKNRPGGSTEKSYITIHETGNFSKGSDAAAHGDYLDSSTAEKKLVSWHYTVDDHSVVQSVPDSEPAYHAGDGKAGPGNLYSIGIEICVNQGGDFEKAKANAASLVRLLMEEHGIDLDHVVQHNQWNGKDCPYTIRHTQGAWEAFIGMCKGEVSEESELDKAVDLLADHGILTAVDYWKGGSYSNENVIALIKSMAKYLEEEE